MNCALVTQGSVINPKYRIKCRFVRDFVGSNGVQVKHTRKDEKGATFVYSITKYERWMQCVSVLGRK